MRGKLVTLKTTINIREERQKSVCTVHIAYSFDVEDIVQWRRGVNRVFCRSQIHLQFILHSCILLSNGNVWEHHCHISLLLWLAKSERRQTIRRIFPQEVLERNKIASNCSESPYFQMMLTIQLLHINTLRYKCQRQPEVTNTFMLHLFYFQGSELVITNLNTFIYLVLYHASYLCK